MSRLEEELALAFAKRDETFKLRDRSLYGTPDFSFRSGRHVVFLHGCFWHGHTCCERNLSPIWKSKIASIRARDKKVREHYLKSGLSFIRIWECEVKLWGFDEIAEKVFRIINSHSH